MTSSAGSGGDYLPSPSHLLEVTVMSAQDLFPAARSMRTFAETWIEPDRRLRSRVDSAGHTDPTWNDKFVFRLSDATLRSDTSAITVDVYATRSRFMPGAPILIGTARAVLSTLRPAHDTRFVALQVRRPSSLRPQGILNIGVSLLDAYARSMPLYAGLGASAALALRDPIAKDPLAGDLARAGSVPAGPTRTAADRELESKLEKWRAELPPLQDRPEKDRPDGGAGRRRTAMETMLEKWKAEVSPIPEKAAEGGAAAGMGRRRRSFGRLSCLSGENLEERGGRPY